MNIKIDGKPIRETPRQRVYRLAKQLDHWKCYGDTRIVAEQEICVICEHCIVSIDGEWDCNYCDTYQDTILHCRKFRATRDWKYLCETFLVRAMGDIIKGMCERTKGVEVER